MFQDVAEIQMSIFGVDGYSRSRAGNPTPLLFRAIWHPRHQLISTDRKGVSVGVEVSAMSVLEATAMHLTKDDLITGPGISSPQSIRDIRKDGFGMALIILRDAS